ncbi:glycosyltransferase family 2 protein [Euhalothece natronophila]|uniref:glycosyltransferase family 2 protein n=1 Tax=Euhalothece natronophila TaxID=577489 RepID=UPI001C9995E6|nr:glycosyltransferase family 2 protein [Euhalothece natronophila]
MKVSVLVSNYNYAQYLESTINSVLNQTYRNYEIIIVDDGSTDNSYQVIEQLHQKAPDKITSIFQENQGQGAAFNTAFEASSGEIIAFLDADDIWLPNKLKKIVDIFRSQSDIIGIMHPLNVIDSDDKIINHGKYGWIPDDNLAKIILKTGNAWHYPPTSGLAYRRSALNKVFPIDPVKWRLCADGCLVFCTAFLGEVVGLNDPLANYRIHDSNNHASSNLTVEKQQRSQSGIEMTNQYLNNFLKYIQYPEKVSLLRNLPYRRTQYYLQKKWDFAEGIEVSKLILDWHFYSKAKKKNISFDFGSKILVF